MALPPTMHSCSATLQPSGSLVLATGTFQGEPPAHMPRARHPDPGMDPGRWPPAPGMAGWPGTGTPGLSRGDSLHPDLWLPGRHLAWFPNKHVQQPVIISPGRHPGALGEGCSCTPPPPPMCSVSPTGNARCSGQGKQLALIRSSLNKSKFKAAGEGERLGRAGGHTASPIWQEGFSRNQVQPWATASHHIQLFQLMRQSRGREEGLLPERCSGIYQ